jgi:septum site-determining protein MinC
MASKAVKLKGTREGFSVTVDSKEPYEVIEKQAEELFLNLRQLARGARVSVEDGEDGVSPDLLLKLGMFLKNRFGVGDVVEKAIVEKARDHCDHRDPSDHVEHVPDHEGLEEIQEISQTPGGIDMGDVKVMAGRVRSGQKVMAESHLIVLGDVNPGGEVFAGGDIIVLGSLCGTALAGQAENKEKSIILAFDFRPTQVQIAGFVAAGMADSAGKKIEFAYVENGTIVVDDYVKANPFGKLPVLEER